MPGLIIAVVILALIVAYAIGKKLHDMWCAYIYGIYRQGYQMGFKRSKDDLEKSLQEHAEEARIKQFKKLLESL